MFSFLNKTTDPVCGMKLNKKEAKFISEHDGSKYYFCSENCKEKFNKDLEKYLKKEAVGRCCH